MFLSFAYFSVDVILRLLCWIFCAIYGFVFGFGLPYLIMLTCRFVLGLITLTDSRFSKRAQKETIAAKDVVSTKVCTRFVCRIITMVNLICLQNHGMASKSIWWK